jgi:DNA-binding SARP family transcriptional activator
MRTALFLFRVQAMRQDADSPRKRNTAHLMLTGGKPSMRVRLLGEVAAHADGRDTDLLAALQPMNRLFFAILALSAGQPVGMERLAEQLWGGFPPADDRGRLHSYSYRVRAAAKNAGAGGQVQLVTQAGGYCLRIDKHSVDVHRFHAKTSEVRTHLGRDDALVVSLAREALREWGPEPAQLNGPEPLAGLPGQWAADYRVTLRRERRDLLIELIAAELRRGGAGRVLAEFAGFADDEAGREDERFTGLLMHAYYLCGRQSEALRTYERAAESLKRKGMETGRELRLLEKKIRNQDPGLDYPEEILIEPHDLVRAGSEDSEKPGSHTTEPDVTANDPEGAELRAAKAGSAGPVYLQRNVGRTVIANQGTQNVNLGGSDE